MQRMKHIMIKHGMLVLLPIFVLTACTGKEDILLEQDSWEETWETETASELYAISETEAAAQSEGSTAEVSVRSEENKEESPQTEIYVHICGAVVNPGVYVLEAGSRIFEGIEAAGGFREDACRDYVNQAKLLQDGQQLAIPTMEEAELAKENGIYKEQWMETFEDTEDAAAGNESVSVNAGGRININTATEGELSGINGIGPSKAAAIVSYRQENGGFTSIEEIMKVSGIGEGTYEKIKDKITVN